MDNAKKVRGRKIKVPPSWFYYPLTYLMRPILNRQQNFKCNIIDDPRKLKEPYLLIGNHASRVDYIFGGLALLPNKFNFVVGYNEFFRSHLRFIFKMGNIISKKNFVTDVYSVKQMINIIKKGGRVCIYPEGMSSISGHSQPVSLGSGKLIKFLKVPVYCVITKGGYLTNTKYNLDIRKGRVESEIKLLFSKEDLEKLSPEEIEDILNEKLYHDDFEWNKKMHIKYNMHGESAKFLDQLLFYCPICGHSFEMKGSGDTLVCKHCGSGVKVDDYYDLIPLKEKDKKSYPETISKWFDLEREVIKDYLHKHDDYYFEDDVYLGIIPKNRYLKHQMTSEIEGEGKISITKSGFTFKGKLFDRDFNFSLDPQEFPTIGMVTDTSKFSLFYDGEFYEIIPKNRKSTILWLFLVEETHRLNNGAWKDYKWKNK